jgi:hypothetical protein
MSAKILDISVAPWLQHALTPMINRRRVANLELGVVTPIVKDALAQAFDQVEQKLRELVVAHAVEFKGVLWQQVCFRTAGNICGTIIYNLHMLFNNYNLFLTFFNF